MAVALLVFLFVTATIVGSYIAISYMPGALERRQLERRLRDVGSNAVEPGETSVVARSAESPLPAIDKLVARLAIGLRLSTLLEQAGLQMTPGPFVVISLVSAAVVAAIVFMFVPNPMLLLATVPAGALLPFLWLLRRRSSRIRKFEEEFPEALDLLSRALRAGHAFQTALGMVAEELRAPIGPEFKKVFDQQNFGLPLRDALEALATRVPLLDVKFFVTAVAIQRDTGGNLSEILDNLSHVVRERFKIQRQVRVHSAHGRITGFVLLALPAALGIGLSLINPEHMNLLFEERIGQTMLMGVLVMQTVGFIWIRRVIKIEV